MISLSRAAAFETPAVATDANNTEWSTSSRVKRVILEVKMGLSSTLRCFAFHCFSSFVLYCVLLVCMRCNRNSKCLALLLLSSLLSYYLCLQPLAERDYLFPIGFTLAINLMIYALAFLSMYFQRLLRYSCVRLSPSALRP